MSPPFTYQGDIMETQFCTITEAVEMGKAIGIPLSRPTLIKHGKKNNFINKIGERYFVDVDKYRRFLTDENQETKN